MVVKEAPPKEAPRKAVEVQRVPIGEILRVEFETLNLPESERRRITYAYEQYATRLMGRVNAWMDGNHVTDISKADERQLFSFLLDAFYKDFKASYETKKLLAMSIDGKKFNCYSSSVLLGDVLTRLGKPVSVIIPQGHVFLAGSEYVLETTARSELGVYPISKLGERYPAWREAGVSVLLPGTYNKCGEVFRRSGRYNEAIPCYDKAIDLDPQLLEAWNNKGVTLSSMGRHLEALPCFDKAIELDPTSAWSNKGAEYGSLGMYNDALECFDKALELNPKDALAWKNKVNTLLGLGRRKEAIDCFSKIIELSPNDAGAWYSKGNLLCDMGKYHEALPYLRKAEELTAQQK